MLPLTLYKSTWKSSLFPPVSTFVVCRVVQVSMSKIQGLLRTSKSLSNSYQGLNVNDHTDRSVKRLLQKCYTAIMETLVLKN